MRSSDIARLLPWVFQRTLSPGSPLDAMLASMEGLHAPAENMIALTDFNGRGIAPGTVFGREFARHIAGEVTLDEMFLPVKPVRPVPFRTVREGYYEVGSQIAHLPPLQ